MVCHFLKLVSALITKRKRLARSVNQLDERKVCCGQGRGINSS
jgi:hypothetical protein